MVMHYYCCSISEEQTKKKLSYPSYITKYYITIVTWDLHEWNEVKLT